MGREKALTYFLLYNLLSLPLPVQIQELYLHVLYCHTCHSEQILYYHCKESPCNARDSSFIPGSGRSHGEGIGYPLQHSWASLVAQTVKNSPAMQETWVWYLDWEDLLEEGMTTHSRILAWRILMDREAWRPTSMGSQRVVHDWVTKNSTDLTLGSTVPLHQLNKMNQKGPLTMVSKSLEWSQKRAA